MATENKQTSTWLPEEILAAVVRFAAEDRRSVSMWIRLLIEKEVASRENAVEDAA